MSNAWDRAISFTLSHEGGYVNHPSDRGGETFRGISRKNWPDWPGWKIIDQAKVLNPEGFAREIWHSVDLEHQARLFYRKNFWDTVHGDELPGKIAMVLFDTAVHSGVKTAIKTLQSVLPGVDVDGVIGPQTVKATHDEGDDVLINFLAARARLLHDIMDRDPSQKIWAIGWYKRLFMLADVVFKENGPGLTA